MKVNRSGFRFFPVLISVLVGGETVECNRVTGGRGVGGRQEEEIALFDASFDEEPGEYRLAKENEKLGELEELLEEGKITPDEASRLFKTLELVKDRCL